MLNLFKSIQEVFPLQEKKSEEIDHIEICKGVNGQILLMNINFDIFK